MFDSVTLNLWQSDNAIIFSQFWRKCLQCCATNNDNFDLANYKILLKKVLLCFLLRAQEAIYLVLEIENAHTYIHKWTQIYWHTLAHKCTHTFSNRHTNTYTSASLIDFLLIFYYGSFRDVLNYSCLKKTLCSSINFHVGPV